MKINSLPKLLIAGAILIIAVIGIIVWPKFFVRREKVFCAQDAKQCSDGSYVGRTGPKCEFAPCPEAK